MSPIIINVYFESNRLWNYFVYYLINKCKYECKHAWARSKCERKQQKGGNTQRNANSIGSHRHRQHYGTHTVSSMLLTECCYVVAIAREQRERAQK